MIIIITGVASSFDGLKRLSDDTGYWVLPRSACCIVPGLYVLSQVIIEFILEISHVTLSNLIGKLNFKPEHESLLSGDIRA